jgi:phage terminase large subunit-like protein
MDNLKLAAALDSIFGTQSDNELKETEAYLAKELDRRTSENRLAAYRPYAKQLEFHAAGANHRERILVAANQVGKTWGAGYELAMHVTGIYPDGWEGRRFDRPTRWIVGSESTELMRKGVQRILLGPPEDQSRWGTGSIPKAHLIETPRKAGVPDAVASISVRHISGGTSSIQMASYDQGRTKWQRGCSIVANLGLASNFGSHNTPNLG